MIHRKKEKIFHEKIVPEYNRVFNFIWSRVNYDKDLAMDLTQSAMELAWLKLEQVEKEESYLSWVMQIGMNEVRKYFRVQGAQKREGEVCNIDHIAETQSIALVEDDVLDKIVKKENKREVMQAMFKLSDRDRALIELRLIEGLKFSDVAKILDLNNSTARVYYVRALETLKGEYERVAKGGEYHE